MRAEIITYINCQPEIKEYMRKHPQWYRELSRNPFSIEKLEVHAMNHYEKTIPQRVQKFSNGAQMASILFTMFQSNNIK